ncbi:MAG: TolC family protein [Treponema sp.]|nr:TolC family protein [Candidatus Treponema merdequi]
MKKISTKQFVKKIAAFAFCLFTGFAVCAEENKQTAVVLPGNPAADEEIILTVDDAVDYSVEHSLTLSNSQIDLELAKWKSYVAWNTFLPTVNLTGTMARANDVASSLQQANSMGALFNKLNIPFTETKETESIHWSAMGNLSVSFNFSVAMIQSMRANIEGYQSGKITWEQAVKNNAINVRKTFYQVLLAQEKLSISKANLINAKNRMDQAAVNYKNGYIPEMQYLQSQVQYLNQVPSVEQEETTYELAVKGLLNMIGMSLDTKVKLVGEINPVFVDEKLDVQDLTEKAIANNLSLKSLRQQIKILKINKSAADLGTYIPAIAISWNGQPTISNAFENDWAKKDNWSDRGALTLSLAWNITNMLPWSSTRTQAKELQSNIDKLENTLQNTEEQMKLGVIQAVSGLEQSRKAITSSERNVELAEKSYSLTWQAYRNGTTEYLSLADTESQLKAAKLGLANAKYNYLISLMDLENTIGSSIENEKTSNTGDK